MAMISSEPTRAGCHQSSSTIRAAEMPQRSRCAPYAERHQERCSPVHHGSDRRSIEMIVVVMGNDGDVDPRQLAQRNWRRIRALGPIQLSGDNRSLHSGSMSTVTPSILTSAEECPNQSREVQMRR